MKTVRVARTVTPPVTNGISQNLNVSRTYNFAANPAGSQHMTITPAGTSKSYSFAYSPKETTFTNLAYTWDEIARTGNVPFLVNSGMPTPHMSFTVTLAHPDPQKNVSLGLQALIRFSRQQTKLKISYSDFENSDPLGGYWHIVSHTINVQQRSSIDHQPTLATVDLEFAMEPLTTANNGPTTGGAKSTTTTSTSTAPQTTKTVKTYTTVAGDTFYRIAVKFYGDGSLWQKITAANNIANPMGKPKAGTKLKIPAVN